MAVNGAVSIRKLVFLGSPEKAMSYHHIITSPHLPQFQLLHLLIFDLLPFDIPKDLCFIQFDYSDMEKLKSSRTVFNSEDAIP